MNDDVRAAAVAYVIAVENVNGADPGTLLVAICERDAALHELTNVAGFPCEGCDCDDCEQIRNGAAHGDTESTTTERTAQQRVRIPTDSQLSDRHAGTRTERARTRQSDRNARNLPTRRGSGAPEVREPRGQRGESERDDDTRRIPEAQQMILDVPDVTIRRHSSDD